MKIASYSVDGDASFGVVMGERIVDLRSRLSERCETLRDVIAADVLDEARRAADGEPGDHALADIVFLPVIPHPEKILAVALNYDVTSPKPAGRRPRIRPGSSGSPRRSAGIISRC